MKKVSIVLGLLVGLVLVSYFSSNIFFDGIDSSKEKIVIIPIRGVITLNGGSSLPFGEGASSEVIVDYIKQANNDGSIKGIILDIDSPGGTVVASKEISDAVKTSKKPVVALMREVAASGAYWIAASSDKIVADPLTITGSVGVESSYIEFSDLMDEYGVNYERIVSGEHKDVGSPFRKIKEDERDILASKAQKIHDFFITDVSNSRNMNPETLKEISEGDVYLGFEAYKLGLVDYLGNKDTAINITKGLSNVTDGEIVTYQPKRSFIDLLSVVSTRSFYYMGKGIGSNDMIKENEISLIYDYKTLGRTL